MPKRGSDANTRIFFDELVSIAASRLKATGVIRLEDQRAVIPLGSKPTHRRRSYRFQKRRLVVLVRLPKIRPKGQKALAGRWCTVSSRCSSLRPHGDIVV